MLVFDYLDSVYYQSDRYLNNASKKINLYHIYGHILIYEELGMLGLEGVVNLSPIGCLDQSINLWQILQSILG